MPSPAISELVQELIPRLLPLLPYLVKGVKLAGQKFSEKIGEKSGEKAAETADKIWEKLKSKADKNPKTISEIEKAGELATTDQDNASELLKQQLEKILSNEDIQADIRKILDESEAEGVTIDSFIQAANVYKDIVGIGELNFSRATITDSTINISTASHFRAVPERMRYKFDALIRDKLEGFVGRQFVFDAINEYIKFSDFDSGYYLIRGEPGIGKSALMAKYVNDNELIHHFNIASEGIKNISDFYENVLLQLISRYSLDVGQWPEKATQDSRFLMECLGIAAANEDNHPIVIAIDALDESDHATLPAEANSLILPSYLPKGVFFVVASRYQDDGYRLNVSKIKTLNLEADSDGNLKDIEEYLRNFIPREKIQQRINTWGITDEVFVKALMQKSEGNFMYLYYVLPAIEEGTFTEGGLDELPQGLREYYLRHWRKMKAVNEEEFAKVYKQVVCILGVAQEPVTIQQISNWTKLDPEIVDDGIRKWREFLDGEPKDSPKLFRVYHASFQDFLKNQVELSQYHKMISNYYLEILGKK